MFLKKTRKNYQRLNNAIANNKLIKLLYSSNFNCLKWNLDGSNIQPQKGISKKEKSKTPNVAYVCFNPNLNRTWSLDDLQPITIKHWISDCYQRVIRISVQQNIVQLLEIKNSLWKLKEGVTYYFWKPKLIKEINDPK